MTRQTKHADRALHARALAELGIDIDELPPLLRVSDIVRPPKGVHDPNRGGLLPISARSFFSWVSRGLIEPGIEFEGGIKAWPTVTIIIIALDGIPREPGHGRKLIAKNRPVQTEQADSP